MALAGIDTSGITPREGSFWLIGGIVLVVLVVLRVNFKEVFFDAVMFLVVSALYAVVAAAVSIMFPASWPKVFLVILIAIGFSASISLYLSNRLFGYTRAWSRNLGMVEKLLLLKMKHRENDPYLEEKNKAALMRLIEDNIDEQHADLLNDFKFFGESVLNSNIVKYGKK